MHRALEAQQTVRFETFSSFLNAWVEVEVYPTRNGLTVYFHDITRRKQAETALENSQKQLRLITDSLPALVSYVDLWILNSSLRQCGKLAFTGFC